MDNLKSSDPQAFNEMEQYINPDGTIDSKKVPQHLRSKMMEAGLINPQDLPGPKIMSRSEMQDLKRTNPELYRKLKPYMNRDGSVDMN